MRVPPSPATGSRAHLPTEQANPASARLDELDTLAAVDVFAAEDRRAVEAVAAARASIAAAVDLVAERLRSGGRLFYCGAGTSGRLGVLDAAELPPTFQSDPALVQGLIAGGERALLHAVEGAEDSRELAHAMLAERELAARDVVLAIAAGGTTPFAHGALEAAQRAGAASIFLACVPFELAPDSADISIRVVTGPEVLAGSTRLKAGTATKLVLNTLSTLVMARLGKVHGNLMVDVNTQANAKLVERGIGLVMQLAGVERAAASELLRRAEGGVKAAVVMHAQRCDLAAARARLAAVGGVLRRALG
ncbi:MAG: N-acetylmuramic acid 6-phosphate etherase [Planctomycetota bacterium]|nr:MAG: N-acetylmuramic acid 6-phosphate etherase [Planctomycetota bacterium]